jgi:hypothetical protein
MQRPRLTKGGEVDFKLRRRAAWLQKLHRMPTHRRGGPRLFVRPQPVYDRRSMVRVYYVPNRQPGSRRGKGRMLAHARYLERGHGHEKGHRELGFDLTSDRVDISARARDWELANDPIHWRMIISPDDIERIDAREHVRKVMERMELDLGTKLQWVAVEHDNTEHKHVHVLLRGVRQELNRDGRCVTLTMNRDYISYGIREISQELVQRQLGPRTEREYLEARSHGIEAERWTELDRAIERRLENGIADYRFAGWLSERSRTRVNQEMERLAYLEGRGLAQWLGDGYWLLRDDFKQVLKDLQIDHDLLKSQGREHIRRRERQQMERELA